MRAVKGMGRGLSDHVVLCKVRVVSVWILRGEVVNEARRNRGSTTIWKGMLDV